MAFAPFVPLRVLSSYSMLEGAIDPKAIARLAKQRGFPAIAICDRNGLYGAMAFAKACASEGVQPIVGTLLGVILLALLNNGLALLGVGSFVQLLFIGLVTIGAVWLDLVSQRLIRSAGQRSARTGAGAAA